MIHKDSKLWIVAPHADDEILGCGGLIGRAKDAGAKVYLLLVTLSGFKPIHAGKVSRHAQRANEFRHVAETIGFEGHDVLFKGGKYHLALDTVPVKDMIHWLESESPLAFNRICPNIVLIPSGNHHHQDHRAVNEAAISVLRTDTKHNSHDQLILEYEIPGTGQTGSHAFNPNLYMEMSPDQLENKCKWFSAYGTQVAEKPHLRSLHAIRTLAAYRGIEAGYDYAEAFEIIRFKWPHVKKGDEKDR